FLRQCLLCSRKRTYANASNAIRLCQKRTLASTHGRLFQRGLQLESIRPRVHQAIRVPSSGAKATCMIIGLPIPNVRSLAKPSLTLVECPPILTLVECL